MCTWPTCTLWIFVWWKINWFFNTIYVLILISLHSSSIIEQEAREGFYSQIKRLSNVERETSISINKCVDLGKTALHIAAEDDSLISHSSVPLPVDALISQLDDLSVGYCSHYSSGFRSSPESVLESIERYLFDKKVCLL